MYVRNRAGYTFSFKYRGKTIVIPNNNTIYSIPDDAGRYSELAVILAMNIKSQRVIYINVGGEQVDIQGHKRRGRPTGPTKTKRKVESKVESKVETKVETTEVNNEKFNVNIDLDFEFENMEKDNPLVNDVKPVKEQTQPKKVEPPKKQRAKRGRPAKRTKAKSTTKKSTKSTK